MKSQLSMILSTLFTVHAAFAASELSQIKEVTVTPNAQLTTWVDDSDKSGIAAVMADDSSPTKVTCLLEGSNQKLTRFRTNAQEKVDTGTRYSLSPMAAITLEVKSSKIEVRPLKGECNGEPELCDPTEYNTLFQTIELTDASSNEWSLLCISHAPETPISSDDVQIKGVEVR